MPALCVYKYMERSKNEKCRNETGWKYPDNKVDVTKEFGPWTSGRHAFSFIQTIPESTGEDLKLEILSKNKALNI